MKGSTASALQNRGTRVFSWLMHRPRRFEILLPSERRAELDALADEIGIANALVAAMSAFGGKADIAPAPQNVRSKADIAALV